MAHPPSFNLRFPDWIGGPFVDWKAKVDLFEQLRREHEFGIGTIAGVAAKFGVHRRVVRRAWSNNVAATDRNVKVLSSAFSASSVCIAVSIRRSRACSASR